MLKIDSKLKQLYRECLQTWGFEKQTREAQEECAEFIVAVSHLLRNRPNAEKNFIEEIADVYVMIGQMIVYVGEERVNEVIESKMPRIRESIRKAKEKKGESHGI